MLSHTISSFRCGGHCTGGQSFIAQCLLLGVADTAPADVLLECLGEVWELHRPFLQKSVVLSRLLKAADLEEERR